MAAIVNLLILYLGILALPAGLSAALWWRHRTPLHRALFFIWGSNLVPAVTQAMLQRDSLFITLGFAPVFLVNLSLGHLMALAAGVRLRWKIFVGAMLLALVSSVALTSVGASFTPIAFPVGLAVAMPCLWTALAVARGRNRPLSLSAWAFVVSCVLFSVHNLDFAFLRDRPSMAVPGFTAAILIIAWISITAPAVVLELVTAEQAAVAAEMQAARRIQQRLLPTLTPRPGLEVTCFMRPAESVGGDLIDVFDVGSDTWFILGDVTGHGLGAGVVSLMLHSTVRSIVSAQPQLSAAELSFLSNRVLASSLARMGEERHVSALVMRRLGATNRFLLCGSHDNIYVVRQATGAVETVELADFPLGLGFLGDLERAAFRQRELELSSGDLLFLGTDGVVEAARDGDPARGIFGEPALIRLLTENARSSITELEAQLVRDLDAFTGGIYDDDVAFLIVRLHAVA